MRAAVAAAASAAFCLMVSAGAFAQQWPEKPVRILVPFPPGGGTDIQARVLSSAFQQSTNQNFIIDNRTGAAGLIAAQLAVDAPPDGYTIFFTSGSISISPTLYSKRVKFDVTKDLTPISWISSTPLVLVTHPSVPVKTVQELVALAKKQGQSMNAAGNSTGSTSHLACEMLKQMTGVKTTTVTYRGGGPAVIALISGEVDYAFTTAPSIIPHIKTGKARPLAVTTPKKSSALPNLPTMTSIYPGFEADNWYAMFFPKGTPKPIVDKMNGEIRKALQSKEMREFMPREALDPVGSTPDELAALLKRELAKYAKVIHAANIRAE
jgi:tripartite-type tricarboxylate transporter receptor subunit TctC